MEAGKIVSMRMGRKTPDAWIMESIGEEDFEILIKPRHDFRFEENKVVPVFIWFRDPEGHWWGSLKIPEIQLHEVAFLSLKKQTGAGNFFDWGLEKGLFCPPAFSQENLKEGFFYPVKLLPDRGGINVVASMKWRKDLLPAGEEYFKSKEVEILVLGPSDLGFSVLVDQKHWGMVYENQVFETLKTGQKTKAFVNKLREDGKLDVLLQRPGYGEIEDAEKLLWAALQKANGKIALGDKSPAEDIYQALKMSKKTFKKALGSMYKSGKIGLSDTAFWMLAEMDGD
jgi:predicted RNA-binding protein (virulence factor B family)